MCFPLPPLLRVLRRQSGSSRDSAFFFFPGSQLLPHPRCQSALFNCAIFFLSLSPLRPHVLALVWADLFPHDLGSFPLAPEWSFHRAFSIPPPVGGAPFPPALARQPSFLSFFFCSRPWFWRGAESISPRVSPQRPGLFFFFPSGEDAPVLFRDFFFCLLLRPPHEPRLFFFPLFPSCHPSF